MKNEKDIIKLEGKIEGVELSMQQVKDLSVLNQNEALDYLFIKLQLRRIELKKQLDELKLNSNEKISK